MNFLTLFAFLLLGSFALGIDEESAKEQRCTTLEQDPNLDINWMRSVSNWYFPIFSRLMLYRIANTHLAKPVSEVKTSHFEGPCLTCNSSFYCTGFGADAQHHVTFENGHIYHTAKHEHANFGDHVLVYTDNKDFIVGVTCWEDGEHAFAVWTTSPQPLSYLDKTRVFGKLSELNFSNEHIVEKSCLP